LGKRDVSSGRTGVRSGAACRIASGVQSQLRLSPDQGFQPCNIRLQRLVRPVASLPVKGREPATRGRKGSSIRDRPLGRTCRHSAAAAMDAPRALCGYADGANSRCPNQGQRRKMPFIQTTRNRPCRRLRAPMRVKNAFALPWCRCPSGCRRSVWKMRLSPS